MIYLITGFINSGKSTFCNYLKQEYNWTYLSTDLIWKKMLKNNKFKLLLKNWDSKILYDQNKINKNYFKNKLFLDKKYNYNFQLKFWPLIREEIIKIIKKSKLKNKNIVIETLDLKLNGLNKLSLLNNQSTKIIFLKRPFVFRTIKKKYPNLTIYKIFKLLNIQRKMLYKTKFKKYQYKTIKNNKNIKLLYWKIDNLMQNNNN